MCDQKNKSIRKQAEDRKSQVLRKTFCLRAHLDTVLGGGRDRCAAPSPSPSGASGDGIENPRLRDSFHSFPPLNAGGDGATRLSLPRTVLRCTLCILISYFCLLCSLPAAEDERFELIKTYTKVPESPPAKSFTLLTDEHQITFIPPQSSIVQLQREKREVWMSFADDRCLIKLQLSTNSPGLVAPDYCEQLRKLVQDRYPEAEVGPANFCYNSCSPGRSFDIQRPTASKMKLITRLAFVPFHGGMLEVSVSASDAKFHNAQFGLTWVLNSLRVEKPNPDSLAPRKD
jgi:hypothetical protein